MIDKSILKLAADDEERFILAKTVDRANTAIKTYSACFSQFLDPYKAYKFKDLISAERDLKIALYGGYDTAERLKLGFFTEYEEIDYSSFPISPVEIKYNSQFSSGLTHRDFLGSILGLGVTREKLGDIILEDSGAIAFADIDIADYIVYNLEKVKRTKVSCKIVDDYKPKEAEIVEKKFTVASMRLDAVLGHAFNLSRGKAADMIKGEKAFLNWKNETSVSKQVTKNDIITLRGYGRIKILDILGMTKKDRILISIGIYK